MKNVELRSDTFTKPSKGMLEAMLTAEVGDDVFEECPTTNRFEDKCASLFGYEDALLCTSGTMANQVALTVHCQAGDEIICDSLSHIYLYEGGGIMANTRASIQLLQGDRGRLGASQIEEVIKADNVHYPISKVVSLENTVNKGGGAIYDLNEIKKIRTLCDKHNMILHLDGARLYNALVATHESPLEYGKLFDSITVCFSKGLGTPMGTVLLGSKNFIHKARRVRKRFGGGWRQSGYVAAACNYALEHHIEKLKDDHVRAKALGKIVSTLPYVKEVLPIDTNIVIFSLHDDFNANNIVAQWHEIGIKAMPFGKHQMRLVTHLDFTDDDLQYCAENLK